MKKIFCLILAFTLILSSYAFAIDISINDNNVAFTEQSGAPFIDANSRTQVPLRVTMESFGANVSWNQESQTAIVERFGTIVEVPIGESYIMVNYEKFETDTAAIIKDNRTYLPIRAVLEAFGGVIGWNQETQTVTVKDYYAKSDYAEFLNMKVKDVIKLFNIENIYMFGISYGVDGEAEYLTFGHPNGKIPYDFKMKPDVMPTYEELDFNDAFKELDIVGMSPYFSGQYIVDGLYTGMTFAEMSAVLGEEIKCEKGEYGYSATITVSDLNIDLFAETLGSGIYNVYVTKAK